MGLFFQSERFARINGRIVGLLLVSDSALSLDTLASRLGVSKASISTGARFLERRGLVERVSRPGDRRDYYQIVADLPEQTTQLRLERMRRFLALIAEARETFPQKPAGVRNRLAKIEAAYEFLLEEFSSALTEWRKREA